ncbi:polysaccharide deacetylase family protein [Paenibacillus sp. sptzw28]|uniref:polysaccharide deacetylase family protein n=1 Tax=Paenibacillus sp. sptzw28 TaxID=715179 RepID=UPI001C6E575C|nr:polysaccharide deacetylase family protein [Paenibacillus sp. sptzw28]QYR22782.1 polysaccharide deacetylase family protein [Paenibacillus sp. sptzw28]
MNQLRRKKLYIYFCITAAACLFGTALFGIRPALSALRSSSFRGGVHSPAGSKAGSAPTQKAAGPGDFNLPPGTTLYTNKVAVLMFHDIETRSINNDIITPRQFESDLDYLNRQGMHFITLQQFRSYMKGGSVPANAALITFDDGYESFYKYVYPILKKHGMGGVCFVITGDFSKGALVYTPHMTPIQISAMTADDPSIEVQAHTDSLHYKTDKRHDALTGYLTVNGVKETGAQYVQRILNDTRTCINKLQPLNGRPIDTFAYPYGLHTPIVIKVLKQSGIRYAFTTREGLAMRGANPMLLSRIEAGSPAVGPVALYRSIVRAAYTGGELLPPRTGPHHPVSGITGTPVLVQPRHSHSTKSQAAQSVEDRSAGIASPPPAGRSLRSASPTVRSLHDGFVGRTHKSAAGTGQEEQGHLKSA